MYFDENFDAKGQLCTHRMCYLTLKMRKNSTLYTLNFSSMSKFRNHSGNLRVGANHLFRTEPEDNIHVFFEVVQK